MPPFALSEESVIDPVQHAILANASETGMGRFFSPTNLNRFRKLANDGIAAAERNRVLEVLAEEWNAFKREFVSIQTSQDRHAPPFCVPKSIYRRATIMTAPVRSSLLPVDDYARPSKRRQKI